MTWNKLTKEKFSYFLAAFTLIFGLGMTMAGFIVPPLGEISNSVLVVLGQTLAFAGATFGITLHYSNQLDSFKLEIRNDIKNKD